jgi:hypothetical protein
MAFGIRLGQDQNEIEARELRTEAGDSDAVPGSFSHCSIFRSAGNHRFLYGKIIGLEQLWTIPVPFGRSI